MENKAIIEALRMCCSSSMTDCSPCPENGATGGICFERLNKRAADTIEQMEAELAKLREENRQLRDATEEICQRQVAQMIRWAGEANISAERGLSKANQAQIDEILSCQKVLTELGRESVIRLKPMEDGADRVLGIRVGETVIFGSLEEDGEAGGTCG